MEHTNGSVVTPGGMENDSNFSGVFINEATIVGAVSVSGQDIYKNNKPVDVGVELELEVGQTFKPKFTVAGNLKFNPETNKTEWSSATSVKILFNRLKVKWSRLNPDNSIPQEVLDQLIGKKIMRLQYPYAKNEETGKLKYRTYREVFPVNWKDTAGRTVKEIIREKYDADVAAGYVKPYDDGATAFPPAEEDVPSGHAV